MPTSATSDVIIVGAGLAGLACARRLMQDNIPFQLYEAEDHIGGRVKTEKFDGFLLNYGFQVLQTAYPEARRVLDYKRLKLRAFAPGAILQIDGRLFRIADPRRRPRDLWSTLKAPIGTLGDRLRILQLARNLNRSTDSDIFQLPDMPTDEFLKAKGFSQQIINKFFKPFFAGVCLDPEIKASSRVFRHIFRVFAEGDVALPSRGMASIAEQMAEVLPDERFRMGTRVQSISAGEVVLATGERINCRAVVVAAEAPETARLLDSGELAVSRGELCLYFSAVEPPVAEPYLILNGNGTGWVNSVTIPSVVSRTYAPAGQHLISVVVIGHLDANDTSVENIVRNELTEWFGSVVGDWRHLKTYRIVHALPIQPPPMPDPTVATNQFKPGIFVCGEYAGVPGIQWALLSGRHTAEAVMTELGRNG